MTEQEQIEDIAKYVCNVCDFKCDWFQSGMKEDSICTTAQETAEALYNAGYRKIQDGTVVLSREEYEMLKSLYDTQKGAIMTSSIGDLPLTIGGLRKAVDEITRLKEENAYLLKACEEQFTFDTTQNKKYSIFNSVRKEFADKVTAKLFAIFGKTICSDLDTEDITDIIDELLKEYE